MSSYNMLKKAHWPVVTSCRHVQLQHVEEDSLASGDLLQTCPSYNMLRKTHWPVEIPPPPPPTPSADMSQLQNVEEDSLASYSIHLHFTEYPVFLLKLCTLVFATDSKRRSGGEGIILHKHFTEYFVFLLKLGTLVFATHRVKRQTEKGTGGGGGEGLLFCAHTFDGISPTGCSQQ